MTASHPFPVTQSDQIENKSGRSGNAPVAVFRKIVDTAPMPFYRFMIHGRDPRYLDDVRGFFTTRHAYGATEEKVAEKVLSHLKREFTVGVSAKIRSGVLAGLTV